MAKDRKTRNAGLDEFDVIARFFAPLAAAAPGAFALTDDAAVLSVEPGRQVVVTTDCLVAGVHFLPDNSPATIAAKVLRVNLSDLAAMGARPLAYTLAAAFPRHMDTAWLEAFSQALAADQALFGITLVGGDTVATPGPMTFTATALGTVAEGSELRRSGAQAGDTVYVSGTIGDAALGLRSLKDELPELAADLRAALEERYQRPQPRIDVGLGLVGVAHAAIDVSDGLAADLGHICAASRVGATLDAGRVPLSTAARAVVNADPGMIRDILAGGDDYEILFAAPTAAADAIAALSAKVGIPVTPIGQIRDGNRVEIVNSAGREIDVGRLGYRHILS